MAARYSGPISAFTAGSSTSRNRQVCMLPPLGARMAASRIRAWTSGGIGSGRIRRMARVVYSASWRSMAADRSAPCRRRPGRQRSRLVIAAFPHLLAPGRIGALDLRNRILMCPMGDSLCERDGSVSANQLAYFEARARGGAALLLVGSVSIAYPLAAFDEPQVAAS